MAELLVRVVDKVGTDFYKNLKLTKRGDVIVVKPDGWTWGTKEVNNPAWRIVSVPDMTVSEASALLGEELPDAPQATATTQCRAFHLDLDKLGDTPTLKKSDITSATKRKPRVQDPRVIGGNPKVIG